MVLHDQVADVEESHPLLGAMLSSLLQCPCNHGSGQMPCTVHEMPQQAASYTLLAFASIDACLLRDGDFVNSVGSLEGLLNRGLSSGGEGGV